MSSPHSGQYYPPSLLANLAVSDVILRRLEDGRVDRLFEGAVMLGAPLVRASFARAYIDANRDADEFDPGLFVEPIPGWANTRSLKARVGLGTIPSRLGGRDIYRQPLPFAEAEDRLKTAYWPYHEALQTLLLEAHGLFGVALLIDCHSMPALSANGNGDDDLVDFAIGDRFGRSASNRIVAVAEGFLRDQGFRVARNRPYAGGYITAHYGRPERGIHALQLELRRDLFMNEATHTLREGAGDLEEVLTRLVAQLASSTLEEAGRNGQSPNGSA